jgi:hypothetical protein
MRDIDEIAAINNKFEVREREGAFDLEDEVEVLEGIAGPHSATEKEADQADLEEAQRAEMGLDEDGRERELGGGTVQP